MLPIRPQLGVRLLADSNSWNVNETPNLRAAMHMLNSQPAGFPQFSRQPSVPSSVGLQEPNLKCHILYFYVYGLVKNEMYQQLQKIVGRKFAA